MTTYSLDFPYFQTPPEQRAIFRREAEDFVVEELIEEELSGEGEHFWLHIRKRGENTDWVAGKLANYFSVRKMDIGYGGKKDRHALTSQWFSVYLPGQKHEIDWPAFINQSQIDAELLAQGSHQRKLKVGQHDANHFSITLHELEENEDLVGRLNMIERLGVPNYFGPQRFGRDAGNLLKAEKWARDPRCIKSRNQRGMIISAARSYLFNTVLAERVRLGNWMSILDGEPELDSSQTIASAPMWGRGRSLASGEAVELESKLLAPWLHWSAALENVGLKQERRALILKPRNFKYRFEAQSLTVDFTLNGGEYATSVLREIAILEEPERSSRG